MFGPEGIFHSEKNNHLYGKEEFYFVIYPPWWLFFVFWFFCFFFVFLFCFVPWGFVLKLEL